MSNLFKPRAKREGYAFAFENPPAPRKDLLVHAKEAPPKDARVRKILRVNPYSTHQAHVTASPPKLGELVTPPVAPAVAAPARDNVMERPVYAPKRTEPTRPGALDAFAIPSGGRP